MSDEVVRVWIANQSSFWSAASTLVAGFAAVIALLIAVRSILKDRTERQRSRIFLKQQILVYLKTTHRNFVNKFELGQIPARWEKYNRPNFLALESLFRASAQLVDEDLKVFMNFVLYFKGSPPLRDKKMADEFEKRLEQTIKHFDQKDTTETTTELKKQGENQ